MHVLVSVVLTVSKILTYINVALVATPVYPSVTITT